MTEKFKQKCNQKGFTLVELMVVIAILGILAAIAIPKFSDSTTLANTAKIKADLRTLDSAIVQYQAQYGTPPPSVAALVEPAKLMVAVPEVPKGSFYAKGKAASDTIESATYDLNTAKDRAVFKGSGAGEELTSENVGKGTN